MQKLTEKETANTLQNNECNNENIFETFYITDNILLVALYFGRLNFLNYCASQKIKFPQQGLYLAIARMEKSLCDLCLSCGCKCDSHCMDIVLKMGNKELVEFFFQKNVKITKDNIKFIFNFNPKYDYYSNTLNDLNLIFKNLNSLQIKEQICNRLNLYLQRYNQYNHISLLSNYATKYGLKDYMTKSEREKYKKTSNKNIEECIIFALQNGYEIDDEIIDLCIENNVSINHKTIDNDKINLYCEAICAKHCLSQKDAKEVIKEIKNLIKSKKKFTIAMAAKITSNHHSYVSSIIEDLLDIKEITKDKEIMEHFLDKCIYDNNVTIKILNLKLDYDKDLLNKLRDRYTLEQTQIIRILIEEYNIDIEQKNINKYIDNSPIFRLLIDNNKIEIKKI